MKALKITNSITNRDAKSMDRYLNEIGKYEVLTPDEEIQYFTAYREGDEQAFAKIILHNLRFVVSVAKQYNHAGLWLGDLVNEGNIGLIKAARRFDISKGFKFISYAVWWIRQSIIQAITDKANKIKVPANVKSDSRKVRTKMAELLQKEEREATMEELVNLTGLPAAKVRRALDSYEKCKSLDAPVNEDSETGLIKLLEDHSIQAPDFKLSVSESQKIEVRELLNHLPQRQTMIIQMYFGINQKAPMTLHDISEILGITRERVRQIKDKTIIKLRKKIKTQQKELIYS